MEKYEINKYLETFNQKTLELKEAISFNKLEEEIKDLTQKTLEDNFWSNKEEAEKIFSSLNLKKAKAEKFKSIEEDVKDLNELIELSQADESFLDSIEDEILKIEKKINEFEIETLAGKVLYKEIFPSASK